MVWNFAGSAFPILAGLVAVPILIRNLDVERFGILTLAWAIVGYFGVFDLGLGRALTKLAADKVAAGAIEELKDLFWTAFGLMLVLGLASGIGVVLASPWAIKALRVSISLRREAVGAFYILALSLPLIITQAAFRGMLSSLQRFDLLNLIRVPSGALFFLAPLVVLPFSKSLVPVVGVLLIVRLVAWAALMLACFWAVEGLSRPRLKVRFIRQLLNFGGWVTVGEMLNTLMAYAGHLVTGAVLSAAVVSYYSAPYELAGKLLIIPASMAGVLFPAFSHSFTLSPSRSALLLERGGKYILVGLFAPVLVLVTFANGVLGIWLGSVFAVHSVRVLQLLAVGTLIGSTGWLPTALIEAANRPDLIAKLHLAEAPLYLLLLWYLTLRFGVTGAALASMLRSASLVAVTFIIAMRIYPEAISPAYKTVRLGLAALAVLTLAAFLPTSGLARLMLFSTVCLANFAIGWAVLLSSDERRIVHNLFDHFSLYLMPRSLIKRGR